MSWPSDSDLAQLFDRSPIGVYRATERGAIRYANPALARLLGYTVEELRQLSLIDDIWVDPELRRTLIRDNLAPGVVDGLRVEWRARDGRRLVVKLYGHLVEDGAPLGEASFDTTVIDVTAAELAALEQRSQRAELARTARTLDQVVRQMPAMYWLVDRELRILRTGGAIESLLGYPAERWIGETLYAVVVADGGGSEAVAAHLRAVEGEATTYTSHAHGRELANTVVPYHLDGALVGAIGTAIDVTALRALERRMVDAQRAESLGVLAGGLAHDFNNLLVAILGNADLGLREMADGAPGRAALANVRDAALGAAELTDQLLAYAGRRGIASTRLSPATLIDELVRISAASRPAGIEVVVEVPASLSIRADATQVRQVAMNLLANARDALVASGRGGRIAVTGRVEHHDGASHADDIVAPAAGTYVVLAITDDGPGLPREARHRVFEPFYTTKPTGHGLGLAAVLGIMRAHGGGLRLTSAPGAGASFQVRWPAATTPVAQVAVVSEARCVLVIDDEPLVRDVVSRMLADLGYAPLVAADGLAGLRAVEEHLVDAALVDLTMPGMSGADVVAELRRRRPELPIILCTGFDRAGARVAADGYLPKPFRLDALESLLARLLGPRAAVG